MVLKNNDLNKLIMCYILNIITTAVDDMERKAPTNTPSEASPPHNCK